MMPGMGREYVLARGEAGAHRLAVLNEAMWPSSRALLRRAGLRRGMTFLDAGCGAGDLTRRVAALRVRARGIDADAGFVARARAAAPEVPFEVQDVRATETGEWYDVVYARYLLSHLSDPAAGFAALCRRVRPGGVVVVEDIDFDLHVAEPRIPAFDRYLELYREIVHRRGGNATLGRHLFRLAGDAGLRDVRTDLHVKVLTNGPAKRITTLTLEGIREAVIAGGLAAPDEIDRLLSELGAFEADPATFVSVAGTYQAWGRRPR
jgi:SAM-dependent methyltransferase